MELVRAPMVLLFQSKASRIAIFYSDNLFRHAPNSKMVIYLFMHDFSHFVPACCFLSLRGHFAIGFSLFVFRSASYEKRLQNTDFDLCLQYEPLTCLKSFSSLLFRFLITAFSYPSKKNWLHFTRGRRTFFVNFVRSCISVWQESFSDKKENVQMLT